MPMQYAFKNSNANADGITRNTIAAAYQYAGIFGQNVSAVAPNTFHVECLNACATPAFAGLGTYPAGTLQCYTHATACIGLPAGAKIVIIQ